MELVNQTPFPAGLFRCIIDENRFAAALLARVTYDIVGETLVPAAEQPWIVSGPPWQSEYGPMESDESFYRGGVDLFVFAHARTPVGVEIRRMEVTFEIGAFRRRILVFGDRVWEQQGSRIAPSSAKPFRTIPLSLEFAYGGKDEWDELEIPFAANPAGKGFYLEEEHAIGRPLPNIEDPLNPITQWSDRPDPVGVTPCPMQNGLRVRNSFELNADGLPVAIKPALYNAAFPGMVLANCQVGDRVRIMGVSESGPLVFRIPETELVTRLRFDEEIIERPLAIDQLGIEVDRRRAFIAYRYPFRYVLYPLQKRSCALLLRSAVAAGLGA
jgi:hypothetical protein